MLRSESYKKGIALSVVFNAVAKSLAFGAVIIIAFYFGSGFLTDLYFYTYSLMLLISTFLTQLNAAVIIPESMRVREHAGEKRAIAFINCFLLLYFLSGCVISTVILINPVFFYSLVSNFDESMLRENYVLLFSMSALLPLMMSVNFLTEIATSYKFFTLPMMANAITSLLSIAAMTVGHKHLGVISISIGLALGYFTNLVFLIVFMSNKLKWTFTLRFSGLDSHVWRNLLRATSGNLFSAASNYLGMYLLSGFTPGTISALNFAQRIAEIPTSFITNQFSSIAAIKLNELIPQNRLVEFDDIFRNSTLFLFIILMPISCALFLFPDEIITIIFKHGNFNLKSVRQGSEMLKILGLSLPLLALNSMASRALMATRRVDISYKYQIFIASVVIVLTFMGISMFNEIGYPLANVTTYLFNVFFVHVVFRMVLPSIDYGSTFKGFLVVGMINGVIAFGVFHICSVIGLTGFNNVVIFGCVFGVTYLFALYFSPYRQLFHKLKF